MSKMNTTSPNVPFVLNERRPRFKHRKTEWILRGPGQERNPPRDRFYDPRADAFCSVCGNHSLYDGETMNVGCGLVQIQPDTCDVCGYRQPGHGDDCSELAYVRACWELQLDAYGRYSD